MELILIAALVAGVISAAKDKAYVPPREGKDDNFWIF
jgi:hypothetical protein